MATSNALEARSKHLDAMVLAITHQNIAIRHDGDAFESLELGIAGTPRAERTQEASIGMEDLYAIIARIGHAYVALVVDGHASADEKRREEKSRHSAAAISNADWTRLAARLSYLGNLNCPSSEPSTPNVDSTRPFTSNIWMR